MIKLKTISTILFFFLTLSFSWSQNCSGFPKFVHTLELKQSQWAFSTSSSKELGISIISLAKSGKRGDHDNEVLYRHETWDDFGYLGAIARDRLGNIFVAPTAKVNSLHNPKENQNTLMVISSDNGILQPFVTLTTKNNYATYNPFGIIGLHYDCGSDKLIASTLYHSTEQNELGEIFVIDPNDKTYRQIIKNVDAMGVAVFHSPESTFLLYASARDSRIMAVELTNELKAIGSPREVFNLAGLGPRGDDKGRKIVVKSNIVEIYGTSFFFNLSAPSVIGENKYTLKYEPSINSFTLESIQ